MFEFVRDLTNGSDKKPRKCTRKREKDVRVSAKCYLSTNIRKLKQIDFDI